MLTPTDDPRPWWHLQLAAEVERRDRDLAERIDALEELEPGVVADRLRRVEKRQEADGAFLRWLIGLAIVAIPVLSRLLDGLG